VREPRIAGEATSDALTTGRDDNGVWMAGLIVVGVDGSETGREGLRFALAEADLRGARVRVVNAWEVPPLIAAPGTGLPPVYDLLSTDLGVAAERVIDSDLERVGGPGDVDVERLRVQGGAARVLLEQAREADLLVVGSRGHGALAGMLLGSVSQACLHHAVCPVAAVHVAHHAERGRIVVGVDGSQSAQAAVAWAIDVARLRGATVHAVCAYEQEWGPVVDGLMSIETIDTLDRTFADAAKAVVADVEGAGPEDVRVVGEVALGEASGALVAAAAEADLLVVGSRGRGGFASLLLGSVGQRCAATAPGVTVVVPPAERRAAAGG
jgi:nucleotide-binding universal stress UspA family protein